MNFVGITGFFKRGGKTMPITAPIRPSGGSARVALPKSESRAIIGGKALAKASQRGASFTARKFAEFNEAQNEKKMLEKQQAEEEADVKDALKDLNDIEQDEQDNLEDAQEKTDKANKIEDPDERREKKEKIAKDLEKKQDNAKKKEEKAQGKLDKEHKESRDTKRKSNANDDKIRQTLILLKPSEFA